MDNWSNTLSFAPEYFEVVGVRYEDEAYIVDDSGTQRAPIRMKMKVPVECRDLRGTAYYHRVEIRYPWFLQVDAKMQVTDVALNRLSCYLNGKYIGGGGEGNDELCVVDEALKVVRILF